MKSTLHFCAILLFLSFFTACNSDMIEKGMESVKDPRRPDINVKQGSTDIPSGTGRFHIGSTRNGTTSSSFTFTIENTGTAPLILTGNPGLISIEGDNTDLFTITKQPSSGTIAPGTSDYFNVTFTPADFGEKSAVIKIGNDDPDEPDYSFTITANTFPQCDFTARLRRGVEPLTVAFKDNSKPREEITSWEWDFGDGTTSNLQNPTHTFKGVTNFTVRLTISGAGGYAEKEKTEYITLINPVKHTVEANMNGASAARVYDIDGDNDYDIIGAVETDNLVALWVNDGGGSFTRTDIQTGYTSASSICAGDIDGDSDLDIIASRRESNGTALDEISYWINSAGSFGTKQSLGNFIGVSSVYAEDMDNDTDVDILFGKYWYSGSWFYDIHWLENPLIGGGGWTDNLIFNAGNRLSFGDIDKDGDKDIITSDFSTNEVIWIENPTIGVNTTWDTHILESGFAGGTSTVYYSTDIDSDGDLDVLGHRNWTDTDGYHTELVWWENNDISGTGTGNGTSWSIHVVDPDFNSAQTAYAADLDYDGDVDIIGAATIGDNLTWWKNDGEENFTQYIIDSFFGSPKSIDVADIDGDGYPDVVSAGFSENEIAYWNLYSVWDEKVVTDDAHFPDAEAVFAADIDNDNDIDIIGASSVNGEISWWENDKYGNFSNYNKHLITDSFLFANSLFAIDIDGDNDLDLLAARGNNTFLGVVWFENSDGNGNFEPEQVIDNTVNVKSVYALDIDGANGVDVLTAGVSGIAFWQNTDGAGNFGTMQSLTNNAANDVSAVDINGDNNIDIIGAYGDFLVWWENDGTGGFPNSSLIYPSGSLHIIMNDGINYAQPSSLFAADFDKDGDNDILAAYLGISKIVWWQNGDDQGNGDGTSWTPHIIDDTIAGFYGSSSVYVADINGDSNLDIIGASTGKGIVWWENTNGAGTYSLRMNIKGNFSGANSVFIQDLDGDGDQDVVAAGTNSGILTWKNNLIKYGP